MHAQTSSPRTTQKIRRPIEMDAIASIEDPTLRFFLEGEAMEKAARKAEAERLTREREVGHGFAGHFGNDNGETLRVRDTRDDEEPIVKRRGHGGAIAFAGLSSLTAIGVAAWMWMTPPVRPALWWLKGPAPAAAVTEGPQATTVQNPAEQKTEPAAASMVGAAPAAPNADPDEPKPVAQAETVARAPAAPIIEQLPPAPVVEAAVVASRNSSESRRDRGEALRGYVWSPEAKAMVPSDPTAVTAEAETPAEAVGASAEKKAVTGSAATTTPSPDSVMAPASLSGPGIAAPSTGPAPDETARVPTTEPAPFEPAAETSAKAPIID